jgi:hypothetical protein
MLNIENTVGCHTEYICGRLKVIFWKYGGILCVPHLSPSSIDISGTFFCGRTPQSHG